MTESIGSYSTRRFSSNFSGFQFLGPLLHETLHQYVLHCTPPDGLVYLAHLDSKQDQMVSWFDHRKKAFFDVDNRVINLNIPPANIQTRYS